MRVLIITGNFAGPHRQPWLLDDLAAALTDAGHSVDVIVGDAKTPRQRGLQRVSNPRLNVFSVGITKRRGHLLGQVRSHLTVGKGFHTAGFAWARHQHYDLCIFTSPGAFSWGLPRRLRKARIAEHSLLFLWDFFPIHQLEIGRIRMRRLSGLMKAIERRSIDGADTVALMSPANTRFFLTYHRGAANDTLEVAPWSGAKPERRTELPTAPFRLVFGGQITKGRGLDTLLEAAEILARKGSSARFLVAGEGPDRRALEQRAERAKLSNVEFLGQLPRETYRSIARDAHVGVAITVPGVTPPSFPSKIVEYCSLGLPVIVCVEASSDAGAIVEQHGAGVAVPAGDAQALAMRVRELEARLHDGTLGEMSSAALALFESQLSAKRVVGILEEVTGG